MGRESRVKQSPSLWPFLDCNRGFGSEVKWMWTWLCAPQIELFNYCLVGVWFPACVLFMTSSQFWHAMARYWSHEHTPSKSLREKKKKKKRILLRIVTLVSWRSHGHIWNLRCVSCLHSSHDVWCVLAGSNNHWDMLAHSAASHLWFGVWKV